MKLRKTLSAMLLGLGCAMTFVGFLALILPSIPNSQLQLVLSSFDAPSPHWPVAVINAAMTFALKNVSQVLLAGIAMLCVGALLFDFFSREEAVEPPPPPPVEPEPPLWEPQRPVRPNPFADLESWEQYAPAQRAVRPGNYASFNTPMLEPNRIEEMPPCPQRYARPPQPIAEPQPDVQEEEIPLLPPEPRAPTPAPAEPLHMSFGRSVIRSTFPQTKPQEKEYEGYTPNEEPGEEASSSRIKSTMGRHREW